MWAASAIGATAAGAGLAVARRRRPPTTGGPGAMPAPPPPRAAPAGVPAEACRRRTPPAEDDPQAALDAARDRLRSRADELRRRDRGPGRGRPGGG